MDIRTIGVVGAGTMGSGIAQVFARAGFDVHLVKPVTESELFHAIASARSLSPADSQAM